MTLLDQVFQLKHKERDSFKSLALKIFRFQYRENEVYRKFCKYINRGPDTVNTIEDLPFLPISLFKTHKLACWQKGNAEMLFKSSGTGNQRRSKHYVKDLKLYEKTFLKGFEQFYGPPTSYRIFALLPSYLEQGHSSLVYMAGKLIEKSGQPESGFFLHNFNDLAVKIQYCEQMGQKAILLGVSYALLDFAQAHPMPLRHTTVMETGGMKGRRKGMSRQALHKSLSGAFGLKAVHSEYGMAELMSQAYAKTEGRFQCPPWMKVSARELNDPFSITGAGKSGGLNIIDLANYWSCSFIETQDLGRCHRDGTFTVEGRFDRAEQRGCNLMYPL